MLYFTNVFRSSVRRNSPTIQLRLASVSVRALHVHTMRVACGQRFASQSVHMITAPNAPPSCLTRVPHEVPDHRMFRQLTDAQPHQIALKFLKVSRQ